MVLTDQTDADIGEINRCDEYIREIHGIDRCDKKQLRIQLTHIVKPGIVFAKDRKPYRFPS